VGAHPWTGERCAEAVTGAGARAGAVAVVGAGAVLGFRVACSCPYSEELQCLRELLLGSGHCRAGPHCRKGLERMRLRFRGRRAAPLRKKLCFEPRVYRRCSLGPETGEEGEGEGEERVRWVLGGRGGEGGEGRRGRRGRDGRRGGGGGGEGGGEVEGV